MGSDAQNRSSSGRCAKASRESGLDARWTPLYLAARAVQKPLTLEESRSQVPSGIAVRDLITLAKPRITFMVLVTGAGGLGLAYRAGRLGESGMSNATIFWTLLGLTLIVSGANALNMYIERDIDKHMDRTKNRPLPTGRLHPRVALWFGVITSVVAVPILAIGANALTALLLYVLAYTPLKQHSQYALHVGAIPGAIPPLLGWTAGTGRIDAAGIILFAVLFLWQIPHFAAITLFRKADYARAGLVVMPNVVGELAARHTIIRWIFALVAASLLIVPLGLAGRGYLFAATFLGAVFFIWGCYGLRAGTGKKWAKSLFGISILYLMLLFAALGINP